ncbi:MAG: hypothetical protein ACREVO_12200 [Steroidobacteraceae bacterium]
MKPASSALYAAVACVSSVLYFGPTRAQEPMSSQLDQLNGFIGDVTCTGNFLAKPGHPTTAKAHGEKVLADHWIVVRYDEDATAANSRPYHVAQYFRYDAKAGHFMDVVLDSSGASYATGTSSGWHGDVITFENTGFANGSHYVFRDAFTRHNANLFSHAGYQRDQRGRWVKTDEETCKRM